MDLPPTPPTPPSPSLPPADWYPDPDAPGKLRYWDGSEWTEHRHSEGATTPDIDHFFKRTFSVIRERWKPLMIIALVLGLPSALLATVGFAVAVRDWSISFDETADSDAVSFDGFTSSSIAFACGLFVFMVLLGSWQYAATAHQLHRSHSGGEPDVQSSLGAGLRRMLPMIGMYLLVALGFTLAAMMVVVVAVIVPVALFLIVPLFFVFVVWMAIKTAFVPVAVVARGESGILRTSANVSATRFWPIFGRLILLGIVIFAIQLIGNIATTVAGAGQNFEDTILFEDTIRFADIFPSVGASIPLSIISWLVSTSTLTVLMSGLAMLFVAANAGNRSEP